LTEEAAVGRLLDVREETVGEAIVLELEGEFDLSSAPEVRAALDRAVDQGTRRIVVDMLECGFVDSTGLGVLLHTAKRIEGEGGMAIACIDEQIRRLLGLTMIDRTIPVFATREDALADVGAAPSG
jgi:anti-sigma B factor antagonist